MDKWFKDILRDKDPYHNRGRDQMRKKGVSGIRVPVLVTGSNCNILLSTLSIFLHVPSYITEILLKVAFNTITQTLTLVIVRRICRFPLRCSWIHCRNFGLHVWSFEEKENMNSLSRNITLLCRNISYMLYLIRRHILLVPIVILYSHI
jgi:hypothetical protein